MTSAECVDITADFGIGGDYLTRLLDGSHVQGYPMEVRTDNGPIPNLSLHDVGAKARHQHILIEPRQLNPERVHREFQWHLSR